jgi:hypothetical protein
MAVVFREFACPGGGVRFYLLPEQERRLLRCSEFRFTTDSQNYHLHDYAVCVIVAEMKLTPFAKELKKWRGARPQKNMGEILGASQRTYEGWESGRPVGRYAINELRRRMAENPEPK